MKEIPIEKLKKFLRYDDETGLVYRNIPNKAGVFDPKPAGWITEQGYRKVRVDGVQILVHRAVWAMYYGEWPGLIDHIDQDKANNCIENLRLATVMENQLNTKLKGAASGFKGVLKSGRSYQAQITINKKKTHLGVFEDAQQAAHAYNKAAIKHFGEFACLNPIGTDK